MTCEDHVSAALFKGAHYLVLKLMDEMTTEQLDATAASIERSQKMLGGNRTDDLMRADALAMLREGRPDAPRTVDEPDKAPPHTECGGTADS